VEEEGEVEVEDPRTRHHCWVPNYTPALELVAVDHPEKVVVFHPHHLHSPLACPLRLVPPPGAASRR